MGLLYTSTKIFHFKEKLDSLPREVEKVAAPLHLRIKPTNVCNHNCWYCAYKSENLQLGRDMSQRSQIPRQRMLEIVDDLGEMGVQAVTFSGGGEPFCYPHLAQTLQALSARGVAFASLTNGSRLHGELAEIFAQDGTWLRVSLDGWDNASYAAYRGVAEGEFDRLLENMRGFKKLGGKCLLGVSLIVDAKNHPHLGQTIARLRDLGVDSVKVSPCIVSNDGAENNRYHAPFFATVKEQVAQAKATCAARGFEVYDAYHALDEKFRKPYDWCPYQQILAVIGADLRVYSCQDKAYNLDSGCLGSIEQTRFRDFWFADKDKFFRIRPSRDCDHHCVANAKNKMVLEYLEADRDHLGFV